MSGPRGGKTDWTDPEQVKAYHREWRERTGYNEKKKEARRNRPAGDGGKKRGRKTDGVFWEVANCTENLHDELSWEIDKERIRKEYTEE